MNVVMKIYLQRANSILKTVIDINNEIHLKPTFPEDRYPNLFTCFANLYGRYLSINHRSGIKEGGIREAGIRVTADRWNGTNGNSLERKNGGQRKGRARRKK